MSYTPRALRLIFKILPLGSYRNGLCLENIFFYRFFEANQAFQKWLGKINCQKVGSLKKYPFKNEACYDPVYDQSLEEDLTSVY